jgi:DNA-binding beta-propeller fold protein YncE
MSVAACGQSATLGSSPAVAGKLVATVHQGNARDVNAGFGSIWVSNGQNMTVTRIDPKTNEVIAPIDLDDPPSVIAMAPDGVWVTSYPGNKVIKIDPATNRAVGTVAPGGNGPIGITSFGGYIWVANHDGTPTGSVAKIDPSKMQVVDLIYVGSDADSGPTWITAAAGAIWVGVTNISAVLRIDPVKDKVVATIPDAAVGGEIVANDHDVWVAGGCQPSVTYIDTGTNALASVPNSEGCSGALAIDAGSVWYGTDSFVGRINMTTQRVVGQVKLPGPSFGATAAFGYVWVTDKDDGTLFKIEPS